MTETATPVKWTPVLGLMIEEDIVGLGFAMEKDRSYHCIAPFGHPLILQRQKGVGWSVMPKAVQERAFAGTGLRRWS